MNTTLQRRMNITVEDWKNFLETCLQVKNVEGSIHCQDVEPAHLEGFELVANLALFSRDYCFVLDHPDDYYVDPSYVPLDFEGLSEEQIIAHRRECYGKWWAKELQNKWDAYNKVAAAASQWFNAEFEFRVLTWSEQSTRSCQTWDNPMGIALKMI